MINVLFKIKFEKILALLLLYINDYNYYLELDYLRTKCHHA